MRGKEPKKRWAKLAVATFALTASLLTRTASAVDCVTSRGRPAFTTCRVARGESLRLFYADSQGVRYETFERLQKSLARQQRKLVFAMNAGMFHPDMKPVGLLVIDGHEIAAINRATGSGNFYLQPNGVFLIDNQGARVLATDEYRGITPAFATQSGPMLLHHGQIPDTAAFRESSSSRRIRNGVCVPSQDQVALVISEDAVTFRELSLYFRDVLGCREALYLDGAISSLFAADLGRADARAKLGPMIAVVE
jgi:uncharacterized protein YigE (DUF2233 family)